MARTKRTARVSFGKQPRAVRPKHDGFFMPNTMENVPFIDVVSFHRFIRIAGNGINSVREEISACKKLRIELEQKIQHVFSFDEYHELVQDELDFSQLTVYKPLENQKQFTSISDVTCRSFALCHKGTNVFICSDTHPDLVQHIQKCFNTQTGNQLWTVYEKRQDEVEDLTLDSELTERGFLIESKLDWIKLDQEWRDRIRPETSEPNDDIVTEPMNKKVKHESDLGQLKNLSEDVYANHIFPFLYFKQVVHSVRLVCSEWNNIYLNNENLWSNLSKVRWGKDNLFQIPYVSNDQWHQYFITRHTMDRNPFYRFPSKPITGKSFPAGPKVQSQVISEQDLAIITCAADPNGHASYYIQTDPRARANPPVLNKVNNETHEIEWTVTLSDEFADSNHPSLAIGNNTIFLLQANDHAILAIDAADGTKKFEITNIDAKNYGRGNGLIIWKSFLMIVTMDGTLVLYSIYDGSECAKVSTDLPMHILQDNWLMTHNIAVDDTSGLVCWFSTTNILSVGMIDVDPNETHIISTKGITYHNISRINNFSMTYEITGMTLHRGKLFLCGSVEEDKEANLYIMEPISGAIIWTFIDHCTISPPVVHNEFLYFLSLKCVLKINHETMQILHQIDRTDSIDDNSITSPPYLTLGNNVFHYYTFDYSRCYTEFFGIDADSFQNVYRHSEEGCMYDSALGPNGTFVASTSNGRKTRLFLVK
jgi:outer membrane protein assembly factor BamB